MTVEVVGEIRLQERRRQRRRQRRRKSAEGDYSETLMIELTDLSPDLYLLLLLLIMMVLADETSRPVSPPHLRLPPAPARARRQRARTSAWRTPTWLQRDVNVGVFRPSRACRQKRGGRARLRRPTRRGSDAKRRKKRRSKEGRR
jgi:hypothetical protein